LTPRFEEALAMDFFKTTPSHIPLWFLQFIASENFLAGIACQLKKGFTSRIQEALGS